MKKIGFFSLLCAFAVVGSLARADHTDPQGSVGLLDYQSDQLQREVQYANLNFNVQQSVANFGGAVHQLVECVEFSSERGHRDHTDEVGCPARCGYQLQNARSYFSQVSRYLNDTQWDFPRVYNQWQQTARAINAIYVTGGPGPNPTTYHCVARDTGWEEHGGGHSGYGRTVADAQRQAFGECRRYHSRCVIQSCN